jgi:hypothetical protein
LGWGILDAAVGTVKIFDGEGLIPEKWREFLEDRVPYTFNPAITQFHGNLLMAYRAVLADGLRRIAICRLDERHDVVHGSVVPLSDHMPEAGDWQADPRFCVLGSRLCLHFNTGRRRPNEIYLVELDPGTLLPTSAPRPRALAGPRQVVEKNWLLFDGGSQEMLAVYRIAPHTVLRVSPGAAGPVPCERMEEIGWDPSAYTSRFGPMRGGTPPVRVGEVYYSFFHSVYALPLVHRLFNRLRHGEWARRYRFALGFYGFAASAPFAPVCFSPRPILFAPPRREPLERQLNRPADRVIYADGAAFDAGVWTVSLGLQDEQCCLETFSHEKLLAKTRPVLPEHAD